MAAKKVVSVKNNMRINKNKYTSKEQHKNPKKHWCLNILFPYKFKGAQLVIKLILNKVFTTDYTKVKMFKILFHANCLINLF